MVIIYSTFPDKISAEKLSRTLLQKKLVACVQFFQIDSSYLWKGDILESKEFACFLKTQNKLKGIVIDFISQNHPYEIPEITIFPTTSTNKKYLKWLARETKTKTPV